MQFIDLKKQYQLIQSSVQTRINTVLEHGQYILGPEVSELEQKLAGYVGSKHCVSCANGTDALLMALMAYGIGPGHVVFTTPFTFVATAEVIALAGATPIFVDIDPVTYNIDPALLEKAIVDYKKGISPASGTAVGLIPKAIMAVDIFGLTADYDSINSIAKKYGLIVIEDAAQSFGATYKGRKACNLADIGTTSFFPAKPLGCYGDGGAIFTNDDEISSILKSIRVHGQGTDKYENIRIGLNGRLDTLQAAILLAKLEIFDNEISLRQKVAQGYSKELANIVTTPIIPDGYTSVWAQYSIQSKNKGQLMESLKKQGIPTATYYPIPLHHQKAFANLEYRVGSMPVSEAVAENIFSLPMHPYLSGEDQKLIISVIKQ